MKEKERNQADTTPVKECAKSNIIGSQLKVATVLETDNVIFPCELCQVNDACTDICCGHRDKYDAATIKIISQCISKDNLEEYIIIDVNES